ncbi:glycosyltransferase family 2 protein [Sutterella sp.]|uniref:glycosyltransferase family 2 protein n=1 Tax=Sutterella sp. TaxID=1981025 RepID=UPI0026DEE29F|nr:glycosyltransferase family 2 protein [Sutterella sp.]MDO5531457.1 glycosyltransferase family 2 protein [Sutterella sp.]
MSESQEDKPRPAAAEAAVSTEKNAGAQPARGPDAAGTVRAARSGIRAPQAPKAGSRICAIVPVYDQPAKLPDVVTGLRQLGLPVLIVDDGSHEETRQVCDRLAAPGVKVIHHQKNQGKGGAVMTGLGAAARAGFTHALQVDADGQIDLSVLPTLMRLSQKFPAALICGYPRYDASAPLSRRMGRKLTNFWCAVNSLSLSFEDAMCGLRVYPLESAVSVCENARLGRRMDFDPEILVRLLWAGVRVKNVPVAVTYPKDGVSHFRPLGDNVRISWMHTKLFLQMVTRMPIIIWSRIVGWSPECKNPEEKTVKPAQKTPGPVMPGKPVPNPAQRAAAAAAAGAADPERAERAERAMHAAQVAQASADRARSAAEGSATAKTGV